MLVTNQSFSTKSILSLFLHFAVDIYWVGWLRTYKFVIYLGNKNGYHSIAARSQLLNLQSISNCSSIGLLIIWSNTFIQKRKFSPEYSLSKNFCRVSLPIWSAKSSSKLSSQSFNRRIEISPVLKSKIWLNYNQK